MRELIRALELGRDLAPIVIKRLGKKLFVVDGHHRLAAYAAQGKTTVPVQHFNGSLEEAYFKSLDLKHSGQAPHCAQRQVGSGVSLGEAQDALYALVDLGGNRRASRCK
jgi:hypothetical protein